MRPLLPIDADTIVFIVSLISFCVAVWLPH
jgi:hypothetical protein